MPTNTAAWLPSKQTRLKVGSAPYTPAGEGEIVVRNHALAINPVDWSKQAVGDFVFPWIKYPFVLGEDLAGEVVEVGSGVTRFKVGDRVLGHAVGTDKGRNRAAEGAFQMYTVLLAHMASPIPSTLSYEQAAVLPLALSTAACGLFEKDQLALSYPSLTPVSTGKTLIIWGGSTSVGCNAIQLAVAAGYEVITTASPHNFDFVKSLGAGQVFDYHSASAVMDIIGACRGKAVAGALAIGDGSATACLEIVQAVGGDKVVSMATFPLPFDKIPTRPGLSLQLLVLLYQLVSANLSVALKSRRRGIRTKFIFGSTLMNNEVSRIIYTAYLPAALARGQFTAAPEPMVAGQGLEAVQTGLDLQRQGVSARKVVITL